MDQNLFKAFIDEAKDSLKDLEANLIRLEGSLESLDSELINRIFRDVHSIKGGAGFLGLTGIKDLAHVMEKTLDRIRKHEMVPSNAIVSTLLRATDALTIMINAPEQSSGVDIKTHIAELENELSSSTGDKENSDSVKVRLPDGTEVFSLSQAELECACSEELFLYLLEYDIFHDMKEKGLSVSQFIKDVETHGMNILKSSDRAGAQAILEGREISEQTGFHVLAANPLEPSLLSMILDLPLSRLHVMYDPEKDRGSRREGAPPHSPESIDAGKIPERDIPPQPALSISAVDEKIKSGAVSEKPPAMSENPPAVVSSFQGESTIRVNLSSLDTLMTLAGELVLTRNQFLESLRTWNRKGINDAFQRLNNITSGVQEAVMSTRMQPVDTLFVKFYRLVREIATGIGKQVELIVEGKEVELDKAVIEAITDPLIHMVRNSIDHGIELPEKRVEAGKPPYGTIWISASHQAGQVRLVIRDDGAGIDIEKVKQKALSTGKLTPYQIQGMSEKELARLIFLPGISTAERVTDISGMGVGMDVVLSNLSRIGGVIDIHTDSGNGTTFEIKLPLTLAIIPGLLVTSGDECFAIPQVNVAELVRIPSEKAPDIIQKIGSAVLFRLRGELVPLITLEEILDISSPSNHAFLCKGESAPAASAVEGGAINIAIVNAGEMQYGITVDSFIESEEIVVKPLGRHLRDCRIYSGATILGNGTIALILDVHGICELLNLARVKEIAGQKMTAAVKVDSRPARRYLVVSNSATQHCAFPLESVIRIERVQKSNIEITAGRPSIRYRDSNLPLMSLEEIAPLGPRDDTYTLFIVVVKLNGREAGFMAFQIVDIAETADPVDEVTFRSHGVSGSLLLLGKTTLIIDLSEVESASPHGTERAQRAVKEVFRTPSVLIAEDSEFFLEQFDSLLKSAGYLTYLARDGLEALTILESQKVDLLLTDIEMPNMNGFDLAAEVRKRPNLAAMPIFAITSIAGESDERRGRELGINEYLVKLDREELLGKLEFWLAAKSK